MADSVNDLLERMLPELEDLEKWKLFTRAEVKEIVRRRREFEYQLQRQSRIKDDYLRYVEYEKQLESLRSIRKKSALVDLEAEGKKWSGHLCDRASVRRIISIYKRAVARFSSDLNLWFQYMEFCRTHSPKQLRQTLARAVQLHPHVPGLWMYSASWDLEHNHNVTAARALMQRGLRMCPHSEDLWLEYFRMELTYAQKLKMRALATKGVVAEKDEPAVEMSIKLAKIIFLSAVKAVPSSPRFRQRFVEALDQFEHLQTTIEEEICASLMSDFSRDESCWDWKARRCLKGDQGSVDRAVEVYENAVCSVPSARMFELYASFLESLLVSSEDHEEISDRLLELYEAAEKHFSVPTFVEGHTRLLSGKGFPEKARDLTEQFCNGSLRTCAKVWCLRLAFEMQCGDLQAEEMMKLFEKALTLVPASDEANDLWRMAMEFFCGNESHVDTLLQLLERKVGGLAAPDVACCIVSLYVNCASIKKARKVYNRLLALPGPSLQLFKHCLDIEVARVALGDQEALGHTRKIFDAAAEHYGKQNTELWLEYCEIERKFGSAEIASAVYYRAKKTLVDPSQFIQMHQLSIA